MGVVAKDDIPVIEDGLGANLIVVGLPADSRCDRALIGVQIGIDWGDEEESLSILISLDQARLFHQRVGDAIKEAGGDV